MSKASIFRAWQLEQLEGLVPMARLHSVVSNNVDKIGFDEASESNIVLSKLQSKLFDTHRNCCYPEYISQVEQNSRTIILVLDGAMTIYGEKLKHLTRGKCMVLPRCREMKTPSAPGELCPSVRGSLEASSSEIADVSFSSKNAFFMLLSDVAIRSVAQTFMMSSNVEFALHGDAGIRSQAITLDSLRQTANCKTTTFYPGEVHTASPTDGMIRIIASGLCSQSQGENPEARLIDTCNIRQIALTEELSFSQVMFFALKRKGKNDHITSGLQSGLKNDRAMGIHSMQNDISAQKNARAAALNTQNTHLQPRLSGTTQHEIPEKLIANVESCVENPFMMTLPAFSSRDLESTLPQSPSVLRRLQKSAENFQAKPGLAESTASSPILFLPPIGKTDTLSASRVSKNTPFWGYTPDLWLPLSNAKFFWALIRLFVHSCTKKIQNLLEKGQPLDVSSLCGFRNERKKTQLFYHFWTISVVYTLSCSEVLHIFNPVLHAVSRVASWHNSLCVKPHFRNAENVENLLAGTCALKCFSRIPESTRRALLKRCLYEEWPPGALVLCTLFQFIILVVMLL